MQNNIMYRQKGRYFTITYKKEEEPSTHISKYPVRYAHTYFQNAFNNNNIEIQTKINISQDWGLADDWEKNNT